MATIKLNDHAPTEPVTFLLANDVLKPSDLPKDTDDRALIGAAEAHPWLQVEYPEVDEVIGAQPEPRVRYEDDVLAAPNSIAFDPAEIKKVEDAKRVAYDEPTAIDAGKDQSEEVVIGGVNETLAADEASDDTTTESAPKPRKRS